MDACGTGDDSEPATSDAAAEAQAEAATAEEPGTSSSGADDTEGAGLADQYGQRYCEVLTVSPGEAEANCTMTASVFFEGIPALNRYGVALLALLALALDHP